VGKFRILKDAIKQPYPHIRSGVGVLKFLATLGPLILGYVTGGWRATACAFLVVATVWGWSSALMAQSAISKQRELVDENEFKVSFQFAPANYPQVDLSTQMGEQTRSVLFNVLNVGNRSYRVRASLCSRTVDGLESTGYPEADLALRMQSPTGAVVTLEPGSTKRVDLAYVWPGVGWLGFLNPDNELPYERLKVDSADRVVTGTVRVVNDDTGDSRMVHFVLETDPAHNVQLTSEQFTL